MAYEAAEHDCYQAGAGAPLSDGLVCAEKGLGRTYPPVLVPAITSK